MFSLRSKCSTLPEKATLQLEGRDDVQHFGVQLPLFLGGTGFVVQREPDSRAWNAPTFQGLKVRKGMIPKPNQLERASGCANYTIL